MKSLAAKDKVFDARNCRLARKRWGAGLSRWHIQTLRELSRSFQFSLLVGDLLLLDGKWYVTHTGLIRLARRNRCAGIHVRPVPEFSNSGAQRWAFEATVYKSRACRGFVGYGDADPSNVSPLVRGAEMRVAETRAVNRALRKAYGIGICSIEEIGSSTTPSDHCPSVGEATFTVCKWEWLWRPQGSRPPLPDHSPAPARCHLGEVLRH